MPGLQEKTVQELQMIDSDFRQPFEVRKAARELLAKGYLAELRSAIRAFEAATPVFVSLTDDLLRLQDAIAVNPVGDAMTRVTGLLNEVGDTYRRLANIPDEQVRSATEAELAAPEIPTQAPAPPPGAARLAPPTPGTVSESTKLCEIADEYRAMFEAAQIRADRALDVERVCQILQHFRGHYESAGEPLGAPWWFIGIIHGLECSFKFSLHLHNGDPLTARTVHVPKGRPTAEVGNPPFVWKQSAQDALQYQRFVHLADWSLPGVLYRWECYNGMAYRLRGIASPYLWCCSDRYVRGKFVADHQLDPTAESKQVGAAVILKRLQEMGIVGIT
jgi:lysozyme family protein